MYDLTVLADQCYDGSFNDKACYAIGQRRELAAGLRGYTITPWFDSVEALYAFCRKHIDEFRKAFNADPDGPAPDATMWAA